MVTYCRCWYFLMLSIWKKNQVQLSEEYWQVKWSQALFIGQCEYFKNTRAIIKKSTDHFVFEPAIFTITRLTLYRLSCGSGILLSLKNNRPYLQDFYSILWFVTNQIIKWMPHISLALAELSFFKNKYLCFLFFFF